MIRASSCGGCRSEKARRRASTPTPPTPARSSRRAWRTTSTGRPAAACWRWSAMWATDWPRALSRAAAACSRAGWSTARRSISPGRKTDARCWCIAARSCSCSIWPRTTASGSCSAPAPASARRSGRSTATGCSTPRRAPAAAAPSCAPNATSAARRSAKSSSRSAATRPGRAQARRPSSAPRSATESPCCRCPKATPTRWASSATTSPRASCAP